VNTHILLHTDHIILSIRLFVLNHSLRPHVSIIRDIHSTHGYDGDNLTLSVRPENETKLLYMTSNIQWFDTTIVERKNT